MSRRCGEVMSSCWRLADDERRCLRLVLPTSQASNSLPAARVPRLAVRAALQTASSRAPVASVDGGCDHLAFARGRITSRQPTGYEQRERGAFASHAQLA